MLFSFDVCFLWWSITLENLCVFLFFFYVWLLYANFSVCFKNSVLDLLKTRSSFFLVVFKFTVMLFLLLFYPVANNEITLPSYQNSYWTGGDKFFTVENFYCEMTLNWLSRTFTRSQAHFICYNLQVYFKKRFFTKFYVLLLLGGSRISRLVSDYLSLVEMVISLSASVVLIKKPVNWHSKSIDWFLYEGNTGT